MDQSPVDLFIEHGRELREGGMRRDRRKQRILLHVPVLDDTDVATLMEDMDS